MKISKFNLFALLTFILLSVLYYKDVGEVKIIGGLFITVLVLEKIVTLSYRVIKSRNNRQSEAS